MNAGSNEYLARAVEIAVENVGKSGGPFGATVVTRDGQVFDGVNRVTATNDPTAHAEVVAIRRAAAETGFNLSGAVLYSSCEPCPMCLAAALWARIERVVYAADRDDAASSGFDDALFYDYFGPEGDKKLMPVVRDGYETTDYLAPFRLWDRLPNKVEY
ncbi:nucleoside deaminase [Arthrobacter sp. NPDC055138]